MFKCRSPLQKRDWHLCRDTNVRLCFFELGPVQTACTLNNRFEVFVPKFGRKSLDSFEQHFFIGKKKSIWLWLIINLRYFLNYKSPLFLHIAFSKTDHDLSDSSDLAESRRTSSQYSTGLSATARRKLSSMEQQALDLVLITIRFRASVFNWTLNWNFGFDSYAALTLSQWHTFQQRWVVWKFLYRYARFMLHGNDGFVHANHSEWYQVVCYTFFWNNFYLSLSGGYIFSKV